TSIRGGPQISLDHSYNHRATPCRHRRRKGSIHLLGGLEPTLRPAIDAHHKRVPIALKLPLDELQDEVPLSVIPEVWGPTVQQPVGLSVGRKASLMAPHDLAGFEPRPQIARAVFEEPGEPVAGDARRIALVEDGEVHAV